MEMELKLLLDPADRALVETQPAFAGADRRETHHQRTTYFDTPDLSLYRQGIGLRIRDAGAGFVQTVKLARGDDALGLRSEWEAPIPSLQVDPASFDALPVASVLHETEGRLAPVFVTEIRRDLWLIDLDGAEIEAVIDTGAIRAGARSVEVSEVELELKRGPAPPVFRLALDLVDRARLRYGASSKSERGYDLVDQGGLPARSLPDVGLHETTTLGQAFPRLIAAALRAMAADVPAAARGEVEGVHRMRAAIRKLRTLLVLFAPHIDREAADRFNGTLRDLGAILGRTRDWDVFLTETLAAAGEDLPSSAGLDRLMPPAEEQQARARQVVAEMLAGPLATRLVLGLGAWTADAGWRQGDDVDATLRDLLPHLLDRLARRVRRRAKHIAGGDADALHGLRKAMKKLRYGTEDVGSLFKPKPVHRSLKSLKGVLGLLGEINDASVTRARLDDIAPNDRPDLAGPSAALLDWTMARRSDALTELDRKLARHFDLDPYWT